MITSLCFIIGTRRRTQTFDSRLRRSILYSLSYSGMLAPEVGFEPTRRLITDLSVFKTDPFNLLGTPA